MKNNVKLLTIVFAMLLVFSVSAAFAATATSSCAALPVTAPVPVDIALNIPTPPTMLAAGEVYSDITTGLRVFVPIGWSVSVTWKTEEFNGKGIWLKNVEIASPLGEVRLLLKQIGLIVTVSGNKKTINSEYVVTDNFGRMWAISSVEGLTIIQAVDRQPADFYLETGAGSPPYGLFEGYRTETGEIKRYPSEDIMLNYIVPSIQVNDISVTTGM